MNYTNLSIKHLFILLLAYNDDPYFDYVQEYRYNGKVYTYADKDSYQELVDILNGENIMISMVQDLDEIAEYQQQYEAGFAVPFPHTKIAHVFDVEQEFNAFEDNQRKKINTIQGGDNVEERLCLDGYSIDFTGYADVRFRGSRISYVTAFSHNNEFSSFVVNVPGNFNDKMSSFQMRMSFLPHANSLRTRPQVTLYENYSRGGRGHKFTYPHRCNAYTGSFRDLRSVNFNDRTSSYRLRLAA